MKALEDLFEISHNHHTAIISMEGLRGFAVFMVFLVHYAVLIKPWIAVDTPTYQLLTYLKLTGTVGVDLFFVISGYLIYGSLIKRKKPLNTYMFRRIQRIYPTFTVVLVMYIFLSFVFPSASKLPEGFSPAVLSILQNFFLLPGLFDFKAINSVTWTLSYEFFYYLTIPLIIGMFSLRDLDRKYRVAFFTTILVVGFVYFYYNQGPVKLLTFVAGILLYEAISGGRVNKVPLIGLLAVVIMFFFIIYAIDNGINPWIRNLIVCFSFVFLCYESFTTTGFVNKLFRLKYLRWLGNMSYSYYLVHVLSMKALFLVFERIYPHNADGTYLFYYLLPVAFAATIVFSMVLYALVEKPYSLDNKPIPFMYWPKMK